MNRFAYVPRLPLSHYVEMFWGYEAYGAGPARERVLPTATSEIVVALQIFPIRGGEASAEWWHDDS